MRPLILTLIFFSFSAIAEDYYYQGEFADGRRFQTASLACKADSVKMSEMQNQPIVGTSIAYRGSSSYNCRIDMPNDFFRYTVVARRGDGCPTDTSFDESNGECKSTLTVGSRCGDIDNTGYPLIVSSAGDCVQALRADISSFCKFHGSDESYKAQTLADVLVQKDPNGNPIQPTDTAKFGCAVKVTGANCTTPPPKETCSDGICLQTERPAVCSLNVQFTGQVFNDKADPGVLSNARCKSAECLPPEPKQEKESKPCTYVSTGPNSVACVSSEFFGKEGQSQCGTFNGVLTCKNDLPKPVSGGISISTEVTTEPQSDGTTKQTKKDTRTDTKCTGMALAGCVTSSTTSTTVTVKDGNGNVISTTGSCTGKGCPDSNTNPDADGDGFGDCVGGDCGEGEGGASGSGVELPELEEVPEYADSAQGYFDRLSNAPIAKALKNISVPTGGSCNIGSVQVYFGTIDFNSFCTQAPALLNGMYYLFLAIWAWAAIRLFFTA